MNKYLVQDSKLKDLIEKYSEPRGDVLEGRCCYSLEDFDSLPSFTDHGISTKYYLVEEDTLKDLIREYSEPRIGADEDGNIIEYDFSYNLTRDFERLLCLKRS